MHSFLLFLGKRKLAYSMVTICAALIAGIEAFVHPILLKMIFDGLSSKDNFNNFLYFGSAYLALGIVVNLASYFVSLWEKRVDNAVVADASTQLLESYYLKIYDEIVLNGDGYYVARIRSDVKDGLRPMLELVRKIIVSTISFAVLIAVLIYISWQAFVMLIVIIPVATIISVLVSRRIRKLTNIERDAEADLLDVLTKSVAAFKTVSAFSLAPQALDIFNEKLTQAMASIFQRFKAVRFLQGASDMTMVLSDACTIFVGAWLVFRDQMSIGSFIGFMNAFWRAATTLVSIFNNLAVLHGLTATVDRLAQFSARPVKGLNRGVGNSIESRAIDYAYGKTSVLSNFDISINPGEHVLIIGDNGSGKTTLANILSGYLSPSNGHLKIPEKVSAATLPISFPPVKVSNLPIDQDLLDAFELNTSSILGSWPDQLSVGQQQKLMLGLVLSRDAEAYILDEPFANLDSESRVLAMREINRRTSERILVIIMHESRNYWKYFDRVVKLENKTSRQIFETEAEEL